MSALISLCLFTAVSAPTKLAVAPLSRGDGTTEGMVKMLGESFTAELRRQSSYQVLSYEELENILSHEQINDLVGCMDPKCFAAIGDKAGATVLATGSVGRVGRSWVLTLKLIDTLLVKVIASSDRRTKKYSADAVLDLIPPMVSELVEKAKGRGSAVDARPLAAFTGDEPPAAGADQPYKNAGVLKTLTWLTDGEGHYLAYDPKQLYRGPIFAGDARRLFAQRISGGGKSGEGKWNAVFWEPRVTERWRGGFKVADGKFELQCGKTSIAFEPLGKKQTRKLLRKAKLQEVRWRRKAVHLARDDSGNYYFIDRDLEADSDDYRLFVGTKGNLRYVALDDAIVDDKSSIFISTQGRLIIKNGRETEVSWAVGDIQKELTLMSLFRQAPMIYTKLGAYTGQALGTPCDPHF